MDLLAAVTGTTATLLWILAAIIVIAGILAILRGSVLWGGSR